MNIKEAYNKVLNKSLALAQNEQLTQNEILNVSYRFRFQITRNVMQSYIIINVRLANTRTYARQVMMKHVME